MRISATNGSIFASYVGLENMPKSEMMKSTQRYGWKLVCGWLPPNGPIELGAIPSAGVSATYAWMIVELDRKLFAGLACVPLTDDPIKVWLCCGIWLTVSVTS